MNTANPMTNELMPPADERQQRACRELVAAATIAKSVLKTFREAGLGSAPNCERMPDKALDRFSETFLGNK
jgi:hypothetical protein